MFKVSSILLFSLCIFSCTTLFNKPATSTTKPKIITTTAPSTSSNTTHGTVYCSKIIITKNGEFCNHIKCVFSSGFCDNGQCQCQKEHLESGNLVITPKGVN